jgi:hypothetical protein
VLVRTGLIPADGVLLGALFESLATLSTRVYAQPLNATVHHLRTQNADTQGHEVDLMTHEQFVGRFSVREPLGYCHEYFAFASG